MTGAAPVALAHDSSAVHTDPVVEKGQKTSVVPDPAATSVSDRKRIKKIAADGVHRRGGGSARYVLATTFESCGPKTALQPVDANQLAFFDDWSRNIHN
jgi:hypothetical protein